MKPSKKIIEYIYKNREIMKKLTAFPTAKMKKKKRMKKRRKKKKKKSREKEERKIEKI